MTAEIFMTKLMSDQTWLEVHTLMASASSSASAPSTKAKGDSNNKSKAKATNRPRTVSHQYTNHPQPPPPSGKVAGTQGKGKFSASFKKKGKKGTPTTGNKPPFVKPDPSSSSKN